VISPDALDRLLELLRSRLLEEVSNASCPKCGRIVYEKVSIWWSIISLGIMETGWKNGHVPYYDIIGDVIVAGYRCPESRDPIVVFKIPLGGSVKESKGERSKGERGGTIRLEELLRELTQKT